MLLEKIEKKDNENKELMEKMQKVAQLLGFEKELTNVLQMQVNSKNLMIQDKNEVITELENKVQCHLNCTKQLQQEVDSNRKDMERNRKEILERTQMVTDLRTRVDHYQGIIGAVLLIPFVRNILRYE